MGNYLVTGGAGFIGSHIAEALVMQGNSVTILDNLSTGKEENIKSFLNKTKFIKADIRDPAKLKEALEGIDAVFHHAAIASVSKSFEDPSETMDVNVNGTVLLLELCTKAGVKKIIFASSSSVYGDSKELPKTENMPPQPKSPYAISKLTCEQLMKIYSEVYGLQTISLRYFNVFGPRQNPDGEYAAVIPRFIKAGILNENPVIFGDGHQTRDFCFIQNVVEANIECLKVNIPGGEVINIAHGEQTNLLELLKIIEIFKGEKITPTFAPPRKGDIMHSVASIEKAKNILGYEPRVKLKEGIQQTFEYFKNYFKY